MRIAVEYAACLANGEGGVVVFGVADRTRGRAKAIHGASGYDLDTWRRGIFDSTRPNLTVEVEELRVPEGTGRLLVVRVPRGEHPPYGTAQGLFKQRVGKNCMPMDAQSFVRSQIATGAMDWSGERSRELTDRRSRCRRDRAGAQCPAAESRGLGAAGLERYGSPPGAGRRCATVR